MSKVPVEVPGGSADDVGRPGAVPPPFCPCHSTCGWRWGCGSQTTCTANAWGPTEALSTSDLPVPPGWASLYAVPCRHGTIFSGIFLLLALLRSEFWGKFGRQSCTGQFPEGHRARTCCRNVRAQERCPPASASPPCDLSVPAPLGSSSSRSTSVAVAHSPPHRPRFMVLLWAGLPSQTGLQAPTCPHTPVFLEG